MDIDRLIPADRRYPMQPLPSHPLNRSAFEIVSSFEEADQKDRAYWLAKSPLERLAACELVRQLTYGYDPATARLPRVFEMLERGEG
jgi:hypothetical protein